MPFYPKKLFNRILPSYGTGTTFQVPHAEIYPRFDLRESASKVCDKWRLLIKALLLILGIAALVGLIFFIGITLKIRYEESNVNETESFQYFLNPIALQSNPLPN